MKYLAYGTVFLLAVSLVAGLGTARITGIDEDIAAQTAGTIEVGCTCHNPEESDAVRAVLLGVPSNYALGLGQVYNLTIRIEGDRVSDNGGFNLHVTQGTLAVAEGDGSVQVTDLGDATHTGAGVAQTSWNVTWTAPEEEGEAALFRLTVNSVTGDGLPGPDDLWARTYAVAAGGEGVAIGAVEPLHIETLGVNWLAYWVGIVSFAFMIVILILYYFVFRYSETSKATDHRDRKKK